MATIPSASVSRAATLNSIFLSIWFVSTSRARRLTTRTSRTGQVALAHQRFPSTDELDNRVPRRAKVAGQRCRQILEGHCRETCRTTTNTETARMSYNNAPNSPSDMKSMRSRSSEPVHELLRSVMSSTRRAPTVASSLNFAITA